MDRFDQKSTKEEENIVKKLSVLEQKLEGLAVEGLISPAFKVREAAGKLIINLFEQGLIVHYTACSYFLKMLNDCSEQSRLLAYKAMKELASKSF